MDITEAAHVFYFLSCSAFQCIFNWLSKTFGVREV